MGLFDFLKKVLEKKIETSKTEKEKIAFSEIGNWIERKRKEIEIREKEVLTLIQDKIHVFANEFKEKINIAKVVDIESKKVEDKIRFVVDEGRKKYIESAGGFIANLESLEKCRLEKFIEEINKIFLDFNKSSHMSYERATILIGKEMADVKKSLKVFSGDLIKIFGENKEIIDSSNIISYVKLKLNQFDEIKKDFERMEQIMISLDRKITEKEEENKNIIGEIEKIKKSEDYTKNLERLEKIKLFEEELEKELLNLKQLINFKELANFFHIFEEEISIVKAHREDFQTRFRKDNGESIVKLLNEAKLNNETISEKIRQINNKEKEIAKNKQEIKKDEIEGLYSKIAKIILDIGNLKNEKNREEKRHEKLKTSKEEMIREIKEDLGKLGEVEVVDF